jgi:hypothetical protein
MLKYLYALVVGFGNYALLARFPEYAPAYCGVLAFAAHVASERADARRPAKENDGTEW